MKKVFLLFTRSLGLAILLLTYTCLGDEAAKQGDGSKRAVGGNKDGDARAGKEFDEKKPGAPSSKKVADVEKWEVVSDTGLYRGEPLLDEKLDYLKRKCPDLVGAAGFFFKYFFYLERLQDEDEAISDSAWQVFVAASDDKMSGTRTLSLDLKDIDSEAINFHYYTMAQIAILNHAAFVNLHKNAISEDEIAHPQSLSDPGTYALLQRATEQLNVRGSEKDALKVLNFFTLFIHKDKEPKWWKEQFKDSRIAGIIKGLPKEEWSKRKF